MAVLHIVNGNLLRVMKQGLIARVIIYEAGIDEAPSKECSHHLTDLDEIGLTEIATYSGPSQSIP